MALRHTFIILHLLMLPLSLAAQMKKNTAYQNYIDQYKSLAIEQMHEHHIPASITLAQALFESAAGNSALAKRSNNHFGIKCHSDWKGKRTYHDDDRKDDCFRVYPSVRDSYEDHSRFLLRSRYSRLFTLDPLDYKGWARGLKACGYATLPIYAERLINVIELYELYRYDEDSHGKHSNLTPDIITSTSRHQLYIVNGLDCIVARDGDTWESISKELKACKIKISARKLRSYNEADRHYFPATGTNIFLEKKLKHGDRDMYSKDYWHKVKAGESMYSISQQYGIRIKYLYKLNYRKADYVPQEGDLLRVR